MEDVVLVSLDLDFREGDGKNELANVLGCIKFLSGYIDSGIPLLYTFAIYCLVQNESHEFKRHF